MITITGTQGDDDLFVVLTEEGDAQPGTIYGLGGNDNLRGNSFSDIIYGGAGNDDLRPGGNIFNTEPDFLSGGAGNDIIRGSGGGDTLYGGSGNDTIIGDWFPDKAFGNDIIDAGTGADQCFGHGGNDIITADLNPNDGFDYLDGGAGDDVYVIEVYSALNFSLVDAAGHDRIESSAGLDIQGLEFIEDLKLTGSGSWTAIGNVADNIITGNSGNNLLIGNAGADQLFGNDGNDKLEGGFGFVDFLAGGIGDDTYIVSDLDNLYEAANQGIDTVVSSVRWVMGDNFENLVLTGTAAVNGFGNAASNYLTGNSARNYLDGGADFDYLQGGGGGDYYRLGDATNLGGSYTWDTVLEANETGIDTVEVSADVGRYTYQLTDFVENMIATGVSDFRLWGNELANVLTGNDAANVMAGYGGDDALNGGFGIDILSGGLGNDVYFLNDTFLKNIFSNLSYDTVTEDANAGKDLVYVNSDAPSSSLSNPGYTLGANLENGTITGATAFFLTGNALANTLTGNSQANSLNGLDGNDVLSGGLGSDTLTGGLGDDVYYLRDTFALNIFENLRYDAVVEAAGGGRDIVYINSDAPSSSLTNPGYTLGTAIEIGRLEGSTRFFLTGNVQSNGLDGNGASNVLTGLNGSDRLEGNGGNDRLWGGAGDDLLFGGAGSDSFVFDTALNASNNVDIIADFVIADDVIRLDDAVFSGIGGTGLLTPAAFRIGAAAADANDRIIYNSVTGALIFDSNGNAAGGAVQFAEIGLNLALTRLDFVVF